MIDDYLLSLRAALGDRLSPSTTEARLCEVGSHLRASAAEIGEAEAVRRFGPLRSITNGLVRQARGDMDASAWRLALGVGVVLLFALALPYVGLDIAGKRDPSQVDRAATLVLWVPFIALLLFAGRVYGTRRWLVVPTIPAVALAVTAIMAVSALVPFPAPSAENFAGQRSMIAFWRVMAEDVRAWRQGGVPTRRVPVLSRESFVAITNVPLTPFEVTTERRAGLGVEPVPDRARAKRLWDQNGAAWSARVEGEARGAQATYDAMLRPPVPIPSLTVLARCVALGFGMTSQIVLSLTLVNALALVFGGLMDRRPLRRIGRGLAS